MDTDKKRSTPDNLGSIQKLKKEKVTSDKTWRIWGSITRSMINTEAWESSKLWHQKQTNKQRFTLVLLLQFWVFHVRINFYANCNYLFTSKCKYYTLISVIILWPHLNYWSSKCEQSKWSLSNQNPLNCTTTLICPNCKGEKLPPPS